MNHESKEITFPLDNCYFKHRENVLALLQLLDVADMYKATEKVRGLQARVAKLENAVSEINELTEADNIGNAKRRIKHWSKRIKDLDKFADIDEILRVVCQSWLNGQEDRIVNGEFIKGFKALSVSRAQSLHSKLLILLNKGWKERLPYEEDPEGVKERIITAYLTLSPEEFYKLVFEWVEQCPESPEEEYQVVNNSVGKVDLVEILPSCRSYFPDLLLDEIEAEADSLGQINSSTFENIDAVISNPQIEHIDKVPHVQNTLALCIYRILGGTYSPTPQQQSDIVKYLAHPDHCPYGEEYIVNDDTSLYDILDKVGTYNGATN